MDLRMSKKFDQDKYDKWDKNFNRWEDDYYSPTEEEENEDDSTEYQKYRRSQSNQ